MVLLVYSINIIVPSFDVFGSPFSEADYYIEAIVTPVANQGMASTILVARIALTDANSTDASDTLTHISSDLQFGSQQKSGSGCSGITTGGDINASSIQADKAEPTPVIGVKRKSNADGMFGEKQV
ncbi:hypothetical protein CVT25_008899 [Psilocybe cyanescens]|uniref:Uncharacterized protein n=1 Tax=Psilocybe cyanescens TaxID=93625 RepID=A0A409XNB7_PSICY|nr:hypothetical protein CVT25_008899 [Psilocybe cyanescens]